MKNAFVFSAKFASGGKDKILGTLGRRARHFTCMSRTLMALTSGRDVVSRKLWLVKDEKSIGSVEGKLDVWEVRGGDWEVVLVYEWKGKGEARHRKSIVYATHP